MLVPKFDLFVFDWDGTIMDTTEPIAAGICHAFVSMGYKDPGMEVARSVIGLDWRSAILSIEPDFRFDHYDQFETAYREYYLVKEKEIGIFPEGNRHLSGIGRFDAQDEGGRTSLGGGYR